MPVAKKLTFDLGEGDITVNINVGVKGIFTNNLPDYVLESVGVKYRNEDSYTLDAEEKFVNSTVAAYKALATKTEQLILVEHHTNEMHQTTQGCELGFKYAVVEKTTMGKTVTYYVLRWNDYYKKFIKGHPVSTSSFWGNQIHFGKCTELPFTEETYAMVLELDQRMKQLSEKIRELCKTPETFLSLQFNSLKLLQ